LRKKKVTKSQEDLILEAAKSFDVFCDKYVWIQDKRTRRAIQFDRFPCQRRVSTHLAEGKWLVCLKARQLGITWLSAAYCLWRLIFHRMFSSCVIAQNRKYAQDFVRRVKFMYMRLPEFLKIRLAADTKYEFALDHGPGDESELRVIAGGDTAGRSLTADLIVFDEQARIPGCKETREACEPSLEVAGGQSVVISTSAGPYGDFYELYVGAPENGYEPVFLKWSERPGRDEEWYTKIAAKHLDNPLFMPREYPDSPAEAFLYAEGRCFPSFDPQKHVRTWSDLPYQKPDADLYRAIDFGAVSAFVCLWLAHWRSAPPGFSVDPDCPNSIREILGYHYEPVGKSGRDKPVKLDDHVPDALRYLVVQYCLEGHLHLYRELYIENSAASRRTDLSDIADIQRLSGWIEAAPHERCRWKPGSDGETYFATVTDPSLGKTIELYNENDLICEGFVKPKGVAPRDVILDGIRRCNLLFDGTHYIRKQPVLTAEQLRERTIEEQLSRGPKFRLASGDLQEAAFREAARRDLLIRRRTRNSGYWMGRYRPY